MYTLVIFIPKNATFLTFHEPRSSINLLNIGAYVLLLYNNICLPNLILFKQKLILI